MKKTTNKGFSMVELIIVIAIMAILAAALAPSLIKYINKSRLSTDIQTGNSIVSAVNAAMAVEKANDECQKTYAGNLVTVDQTNIDPSDDFGKEFWSVMGVSTVKGKSKKDLSGATLSNQVFILSIDKSTDAVTVWYDTNDDAHMISPTTGASLAE